MKMDLSGRTVEDLLDNMRYAANKTDFIVELTKRAHAAGFERLGQYLVPSNVMPMVNVTHPKFSLRPECEEMLTSGYTFPGFEGNWADMLEKRKHKLYGDLTKAEERSQQSLRKMFRDMLANKAS